MRSLPIYIHVTAILYTTEEQPEAILIKGHSFIVAPNHFQMAQQSELRFPAYTEYRGSGHVMCCVVHISLEQLQLECPQSLQCLFKKAPLMVSKH
ncbi:Bifunctional protein GlmU [Clarias magur]|uniref:Bifunctional protein GlmU n=1 Tax=Clarias magur TaxID=1594786 RepID=A0A8J4XH92_CLAMG|nr:Bifunctional protein GlmU [Clarias magur]